MASITANGSPSDRLADTQISAAASAPRTSESRPGNRQRGSTPSAVADGISSYDHCGRTADDWNSAMFDLWAEMFGRVMTAEQVKDEIEAAASK